MSCPDFLFLRINQKVRGPYSAELVAELAHSGVITPATEASEYAAGPWVSLEATAYCAAIFPVRPETTFKSPTFEIANLASLPPVDHHALIAAANRPPRPPTEPDPSQPAATQPANDVAEILRENLRIQTKFEKPLDLTPRPNRRRLDYLITLGLTNGFFFWRLIANWSNPAVLVYSLSGIVVCTIGITWVMYGVMDRY